MLSVATEAVEYLQQGPRPVFSEGPQALKNIMGSEFVWNALLFIRTNEDRKYIISIALKSPRGPPPFLSR
jgi:hypothetical protein